jgi:RNA polymerase sigma-70 factor (ECF subfamily)
MERDGTAAFLNDARALPYCYRRGPPQEQGDSAARTWPRRINDYHDKKDLEKRNAGGVMEASDRAWRERGLREAVLGGDEQAWRRWYDECFDDLYAYVQWRCGGLRDHADELIQDVWLTAVRRLATFDPARGSFAGWLHGIAAGLARNHFRRARRRRAVPLPDDVACPGQAEQARREQAEQVARALAGLPEHYEAVLRGKYLDGASVADLAAARGESVKATESLLTRAREAFRAAFRSEE